MMETRDVKLDTYTTYQIHSGRTFQGDLITEVHVMVNAGSGCALNITSAKYITASFYFAHSDQRRRIDQIGHAGAYLVDRATDPVAFSREMIESSHGFDDDGDNHGSDYLDETRKLVSTLYTSTGGIKSAMSAHFAALSVSTILVIDHFVIDERFRACGLGKTSMTGFLWTFGELAKQRGDMRKFSGMVLCSPSKISGERYERHDEGGRRTEQEVDEGLVRLFEMCGFDIWVEGSREAGRRWVCGMTARF